MNNADTDALSGRELDAAIAVALGWRWMQNEANNESNNHF